MSYGKLRAGDSRNSLRGTESGRVSKEGSDISLAWPVYLLYATNGDRIFELVADHRLI
jgi:hypothetical protein